MDWYKFFMIAAEHLTVNRSDLSPPSWCSWTTFRRLREDAGYWTYPIPKVTELLESRTTDGGTWGQPFPYEEIAHFIIPYEYFWEIRLDKDYVYGTHVQDIGGLSALLTAEGIEHRLTDLVLEIKLY